MLAIHDTLNCRAKSFQHLYKQASLPTGNKLPICRSLLAQSGQVHDYLKVCTTCTPAVYFQAKTKSCLATSEYRYSGGGGCHYYFFLFTWRPFGRIAMWSVPLKSLHGMCSIIHLKVQVIWSRGDQSNYRKYNTTWVHIITDCHRLSRDQCVWKMELCMMSYVMRVTFNYRRSLCLWVCRCHLPWAKANRITEVRTSFILTVLHKLHWKRLIKLGLCSRHLWQTSIE